MKRPPKYANHGPWAASQAERRYLKRWLHRLRRRLERQRPENVPKYLTWGYF